MNAPMNNSWSKNRGVATPRHHAPRRGFTLVEMLVAVTLVLLMMALLGEVFSIATETVSTQRGLAENDQKARILQTVFDRDVKTRTFERVAAFAGANYRYVATDTDPDGAGPLMPDGIIDDWQIEQAGGVDAVFPQDTLGLESVLQRRKGYFAIGENDPDDPLDDTLSFTIDAARAFDPGGTADQRFFGAAATLPLNPATVLATRRNQPDLDDGLPTADGTGTARFAEVRYFVREGRLIRSVRPIRDTPYFNASAENQPVDNAATPLSLFDSDGDPATGGLHGSEPWPNVTDPGTKNHDAGGRSYANFLDFAAYRDPQAPNAGPLLLVGGDAVLSNAASSTPQFRRIGGNREVPFEPVLGLPFFRLDHGFTRYGRPREHLGRATDWLAERNTPFIGGFLKSERAHRWFNDPGRPGYGGTGNSGPFVRSPYTVDDLGTLTGGGAIAALDGGDRRGEDVLLSNVHAFDIKVWDAGLSEGVATLGRQVFPAQAAGLRSFVDLGHTTSFNDTSATPPVTRELGDFHIAALQAQTFNTATGLFFHSRTPNAAQAVFDTEARGQNPYGNRFDTWHPNMVRVFDDGTTRVELPYPPPYRPLATRRVLVDGALRLRYGPDGLPGGGRVDDNVNTLGDFVHEEDPFAVPPAVPASHVLRPQQIINRMRGAGAAEEEIRRVMIDRDSPTILDPDALPDPNEIGALGSDDEVPLRAILITVRFYDPASDQLREVSFRHNLIDP